MSLLHKIDEVVKITDPVTVTGTVTVDTSLLAKETGGNLASVKTNTDNLDVALSTRLKPADTLAAVTTVGTITNPVAITNANLDAKLSDIKAKTDNLDAKISDLTTAVNTLLKPANTLTKVTTVDTITNAVSVANGSGIKIYDEIAANYKGLRFNAGNPQICAQPYLQAMAEGDITGHTPFSKLGYNADIGASEEDIWGAGGIYPWIAAGGIALEVVSSNANDTIAGTGIQKVRVSYLDTDYSAQSQILNMNGTTPVALTDTTILRVNSLRATQVGANGVAAGAITCRLVGGAATIYRQIDAGFTLGRGCTYTVPLGKTLYITSVAVSSGASAKSVRWVGRAQVDDTAPTTKINFFQPFFEMQTQDSSFYRDFEIPIVVPATADLRMSAISAGAGSICSCALRGWLE